MFQYVTRLGCPSRAWNCIFWRIFKTSASDVANDVCFYIGITPKNLDVELSRSVSFVSGSRHYSLSVIRFLVSYIIFSSCGFFFFYYLFPRLISAVGDWMSAILPHMVWP